MRGTVSKMLRRRVAREPATKRNFERLLHNRDTGEIRRPVFSFIGRYRSLKATWRGLNRNERAVVSAQCREEERNALL